jgi:hypothetical protein
LDAKKSADYNKPMVLSLLFATAEGRQQHVIMHYCTVIALFFFLSHLLSDSITLPRLFSLPLFFGYLLSKRGKQLISLSLCENAPRLLWELFANNVDFRELFSLPPITAGSFTSSAGRHL